MSQKNTFSIPPFYTILTMFLALMIAVILIAPTAQVDKIPELDKGYLDLSNWEYSSAFPLTGEWDFYWDKLLTANDFASNPKPDLRADLPSAWNSYSLAGKKLPGFGFATFRLHVTGVQPGKQLAMRIEHLSTSYILTVDGNLLAKSGIVGKAMETAQPENRLQSFIFTPETDNFDIILNVSNFSHALGGASQALYLGTPEKIEYINHIVVGRDYFLLGSFFITASLCLMIYVVRRNIVLLLYVAMCALLTTRTAINGSYPIHLMFPYLSFSANARLDYLSLYWLPNVYYWILLILYPREFSRKTGILYLFFAITMSVLTLVMPVSVFTKLLLLAHIASFLIGFASIYMLIKALKTGAADTPYVLVGVSVLLLCLIHDVLFAHNIIKIGFLEYYPTGFLVTSILWCSVLILRYRWMMIEKRRALQELKLSSEREKKTELKFLKSQIRPHFLNNALNTIISVSRTDGDRSRALLVEFSKYLRGCYDFDSLDDTIPIESELSYVRSYMTLELARFGDRLQIEYDIDAISVSVPPLILQPLAENAVVHGVRSNPDGGSLVIYVKAEGSYARIGVRDNGVGIPAERVESILSGNTGARGVGLFNINQRLNRLYNTSLHIKNLERGVDVYMLIPYKEANLQ